MDDRERLRQIRHRLAALHHAEEVSGNVAATCRCYGISRPTAPGPKSRTPVRDAGPQHKRVDLTNEILEYLEIGHNRQPRHTSLGMVTPIEIETRHQRHPAA